MRSAAAVRSYREIFACERARKLSGLRGSKPIDDVFKSVMARDFWCKALISNEFSLVHRRSLRSPPILPVSWRHFGLSHRAFPRDVFPRMTPSRRRTRTPGRSCNNMPRRTRSASPRLWGPRGPRDAAKGLASSARGYVLKVRAARTSWQRFGQRFEGPHHVVFDCLDDTWREVEVCRDQPRALLHADQTQPAVLMGASFTMSAGSLLLNLFRARNKTPPGVTRRSASGGGLQQSSAILAQNEAKRR
jgi:hypothetical protein